MRILIVSKGFMIKIYLPNLDNKFINNIKFINDNNFQFYLGDGQDIYRIHKRIMPSIYVFSGIHITNDIFEFISEYGDIEAKIYIYHNHNEYNKDTIRYIKKAKHLIDSYIYNDYKNYSNTIEIPNNLINNYIYFNRNEPKQDITAYFLDNDKNIPESIANRLYPKTKDKIWLFNSRNIKHIQNLGLLTTEQDKSYILNKCKYFIPNKYLDYAVEAVACGCNLLSLEDMSDITTEFVAHNTDTISYVDFLKKNIL